MSAHDHQSPHAGGSSPSLRARWSIEARTRALNVGRRTYSLLAVLPQQSARAEAARGILLVILLVIVVLLREAGGL